ncbi:MAG: methyltransferase domain-containing protein [Alphaproteobacteria bacterium]
MLISESYRRQNAELHGARPGYGAGHATRRWLPVISRLAQTVKAESILDYGCGKGWLKGELGERVCEYDPAIPGKDSAPRPADLVVSLDVLEHIEPGCLDAVLDDLKRLTLKCGFFTVAMQPAVKTLPDGRNAHLIIESPEWWLPRVWARWRLAEFKDLGGEFLVLVAPR